MLFSFGLFKKRFIPFAKQFTGMGVWPLYHINIYNEIERLSRLPSAEIGFTPVK